jgi:hemolysin activation/secretion protein
MFAGVLRWLAVMASVLVSAVAIAQPIPPAEQPGRERERFIEPPAPRAQPGGSVIALPSTTAPPGAAQVIVVVRDVRIVGSTVYTAAQLAPLYEELIGETVSLQAIYDLAQKITAKYGADGYVLSRAIVPPQNLNPRGATLRIQIVEGYVDRVEWPASLSRYRDFFSYYESQIIADRPVNIRTIERYLLLAGDLPGLRFKNSLKPSASKQGAATLVVEVSEKPFDALARFDNRGSQARGPYQYMGSVTANNLLRIHEAFTVTYAGTTQTRELQYFAAGYRQVLTGEGLTVFANASYGNGRPGTFALELLEYRTRSALLEAGLSYPFIRSRERNLTLTLLGFASDDRSDILGDVNSVDRLRGVRAKLDVDYVDAFASINQLILVYSRGFEGFGSTANDNVMSSRPSGRVDFSKFEATFSRLQPLFARTSLFLAVYGQHAHTGLLSPELCGYGGRAFGRAYDPSEITADSCAIVLGELRYDLPHNWFAQLQAYGFADRGWLRNLEPASGSPDKIDASSAGVGLRLGWPNVVTADLSAAKVLDGPRAQEWRGFFIVTARY